MSSGMRPSRGVVALVLTAVAVSIPCAAWYLAGSRQVEQESLDLEREIRSLADRQGRLQAEKLATRLEALRSSESRRPFYHYQNLFHDPQGASEGVAVTPSPLSGGAVDPLVLAHFQVDEEGGLTLPTVNDAFPELGLEHAPGEQCAIQWELAEVAQYCSVGLIEKAASSVAQQGDLVWSSITYQAWSQNRRANEIFGDLKYGTAGAASRGVHPIGQGIVLQIGVGELAWHTLPVGEEPGLVALRRVETPVGTWFQGLVVAAETLRSEMPTIEFPLRLTSGLDEPSPGEASFLVGTTGWQVRLDLSAALEKAEIKTRARRRAFLGSFVLGSLGASLAGLVVVLLVVQSDRLARQRSRFAAAAAHELRTPLAGLRLHAEMLAEGLGDPKKSGDYARRIASEVERLGRVVTNVLGFTRLERGAIQVEAVPGELGSVIEDIVRRHRPLLEGAGLAIDLRLSRDLVPVAFDRDAMVQVLGNLLDNAEKHTRSEATRSVRVDVERDGDDVVLVVADDGPGIPPSLRRSLFRPFARGGVDPSTEGIGLGLALVRSLVEAQGARVSVVDSDLGGAAFEVRFPVVEGQVRDLSGAGSGPTEVVVSGH